VSTLSVARSSAGEGGGSCRCGFAARGLTSEDLGAFAKRAAKSTILQLYAGRLVLRTARGVFFLLVAGPIDAYSVLHGMAHTVFDVRTSADF
jgi:hypothetical protein